jgi:cytoskeletal protein RodZ
MESIGEKIRKVREEKGYSLDQVARDTHITKRFLEALEEENFASLPGESYVVGFLRSYAEYLGLNSEEIVLLYRNMKLQEQPAPMNELLERPRISPVTIVALIIIAVVVVTAGTFIVLSGNESQNKTLEAKETPKTSVDPKAIQADILERAFVSGDSVRIPIEGVDTDMSINVKDEAVSLSIGNNTIALPLQKESLLDINQDGKMDIKVTVRSIDTKATPRKAIIRFDRVVQSPQSAAGPGTGPAASATASPLANAVPAPGVPLGSTNIPTRLKQSIPIAEYSDQQVINLGIRFDAPTTFRYETDGGKKDERQAAAGENLVVSTTGWIRVWSANGAKTNLKIGTREIKAGNEGEVVAWSLQWGTNATGARQLELVPMY